ncbi:MAG: tetratricopeptide repeat protein [Actinomycetaceae bacterium]|nr:tetratricopeptide repeat protein [Arcanobacterium sp.]MDD7504437.1 tetratricopeptide repeat protein [Actinomycetaceae bacterium]MDY6143381.1 tetratricopeptide repeat protein [Arcanobacterium sp.]
MAQDPFGGYAGGVVDLGALKQQTAPSRDSAAQAQDAQGLGTQANTNAGTRVPGAWVTAVTASNLESIIKASLTVPYIVIFVSAVAENSLTLKTNMEDLAQQYQGKFGLGIVDTDAERDVAQMFGVNAVPTAIALLQGQPIPLFQGLPAQDQLADSVAKLRMAAEQYGLNGVLDGQEAEIPEEPQVPPLHKEGLEALQAGDLDAAHAAYSQALKENPGDTEALTALRQVELLQRVKVENPGGTTQSATQLLEKATNSPMSDAQPHLVAADIEVAFNRPDAAFARLVEVVRNTEGDARDQVRERLIELFDVVGTHTDLVKEARKALTNALF